MPWALTRPFQSATYKSNPITPTDEGGKLVFALGEVTGTTTLTVVTTPTDGAFGAEGSTTTLTNDVELYTDASTDPLDSDDGTADITTDWIRKSGTHRRAEGVDYIDWTITLNNNNRTIPAGSTVTDTLPEFLEYVTGSVRRNGAAPSIFDDIFGIAGQILTYIFNPDGSAATGVQTITFSTKVLEGYYEQQSQTSFTNTATLTTTGGSYGDTSQGVGVGTSLLAKTGEGYAPDTRRITWALEINRNGQEFTAATVVDTLGDNQVFYAAGGVTRSGSGPLTQVSTLEAVDDAPNQYYYNETSRVLTIYLGTITAADNPTLTFQTVVTEPEDYADNGTVTYDNAAVLTGNGIQSSSSTGEQDVESEVIAKEATGYNYLTRRLSWAVTVNQNGLDMPNAVVTDTVQPGQAYVAGSLRIDGADPGTRLDVAGNILTVTLGPISQQVVITFETEVTDLSVFLSTNGDVTFRNHALLSSGIEDAPTVGVWGDYDASNKAIEKKLHTEYTPENGYIGWEVFVNANQAPMANAALADQLQSGLELDNESVELYYWNQDAAGTRTVGDPVPSGSYSFTYDYETRLFELNLPDGDQGYYLTFRTDVLAPGTYSNTIGFTSSYTGSDGASSNYTVTTANIEVSTSGWNGSITVTKVDEAGNPILSGAEFELLDSMRNVKTTLVTDGNGQAKFERLKLRTYYVREKTAPLGYRRDTQEFEITLTGDTTQTRNIAMDVENELLRASVTLRKTDENDNPLSGGRFGIYAAEDTGFETPLQIKPAVGGTITFLDLPAGDYVIREIAAPSGYARSDITVPVSLVLDSTSNTLADVILNESLVNERVEGSVELRKTDKDGAPLKGAVLGLYDFFGNLLQTATSDVHGTILFLDVPFGNYTVKEISAPAGFVLSQEVVTVSVTDAGVRTSTYLFVNQREAIFIPTTGGPGDALLPVALAVLPVLAACLFFLYRKTQVTR